MIRKVDGNHRPHEGHPTRSDKYHSNLVVKLNPSYLNRISPSLEGRVTVKSSGQTRKETKAAQHALSPSSLKKHR